jgi:predicted RNA-binding protein with PUA-like domain
VVDIAFVRKLDEPVTLTDIRADPSLGKMMILQPGSRLSVTPVFAEHFLKITNLKALTGATISRTKPHASALRNELRHDKYGQVLD